MAIQFLNTGYFPDNAKLTFGDATTPDLEIYHDGSHSRIDDTGTGGLILRTGDFYLRNPSDADMIYAASGGAVKLYYNNVVKFETVNAGSWFAGNLYCNSGSKIHFDNGSTNDYYIEKSGTSLTFNTGGTYVFNTGDATFTGDVIVSGSDTATLSETGLALSRSNSYIQSTSDNSDTLNIGQSSVRWGHVKVDGADFAVLNGGNERFKIDSTGNATFAGEIKLQLSSTVQRALVSTGTESMQIGDAGTQMLRFKNAAGISLDIAANGNTTFIGDILTNTDSSSDIGKTATRWANIWVDNINGAPPLSGSYLPLAGGTMTGDVTFNDNVDIKLGTSNDASIFHDGTNTYIDNGTGALVIRNQQDDGDIIFYCDDGSGGVEEYFRLDGSAGSSDPVTVFPDSSYLKFGSSQDFSFVHNGSTSYIQNFTGDLQIQNNADDADILFRCDDGSGGLTTYFYLDGSIVENRFSKATRHSDNIIAKFGDSNDLNIYSNGSNSYIENFNNDFIISNTANDQDIKFFCDDGSGGVTEYFRLDGGWADGTYKYTVWPDNGVITLGAGADLSMYHDGSDSFIKNSTGSLVIEQAAGAIALRPVTGENGILIVENAAVSLYYDNSKKFETTNTGATITGGLTTTASSDIAGLNMTSNIAMGGYDITGLDEIYFSTNTKLGPDGTGYLKLTYIASGGGGLKVVDGDGLVQGYLYGDGNATSSFGLLDGSANWAVRCVEGEGVNLRYNNSKKFETTTVGATITGALSITGDGSNAATLTESSAGILTIATVDDFIVDAEGDIAFDANGGDIRLKDGGAQFGSLYTGGGATHFYIESIQQDKDIIFKGNDGGSTITALTLDMSDGGTALFGHHISIPDYITHYQDASTRFGFSGASTFVVNTGGTTALTINSSQGAAFSAKATSAATVDGDGSTTMVTKGWVESKLTGATLYQGTWDPSSGTYGSPDLSTASLQVNGYYYICSANGSATPNGAGTEPDSWHTGDWVIWNDDLGASGQWQKIDNTTVLSGAGTGEYLAKWTDSETLGDSVVLVSGNDIVIPQYIRHTGDTTTYFGFYTDDTYKVVQGGSDRFQITGDVHVKGATDFAIPAARKLYLDGQGNTYLTESSADTIKIFTGGTEALEINSSQNSTFAGDITVGALTSGETAQLVVNHEGGATPVAKFMSRTNRAQVQIGDNDTNGYLVAEGDVFSIGRTASASANNINIDASHNVGIGTTTPASKLSIEDGDLEFLTTSAATIKNKIIFSESVWGDESFYIEHDGSGAGAANILKIYGDGSGGTASGIVIARTGDVGIGTNTSPDTNLHVFKASAGTVTAASDAQLVVENSGVTAINLLSPNTSHGQIIFGDPDDNDVGQFGYDHATNGMYIKTNGSGTKHFFVDSTGDVGIGTTSPDAKLDVNGGIIAGGKTTYTISSASLTTTGTAVAGLSTGANGYSAGFVFTCFGGNGYQRIVYSCKNVGGTWDIDKDIDEGVNAFDVTYAADGSDNITFTFKSRSGTQSYSPKVTVEAIGSYIQTSYIN